jgi:hypothetical protein
MAAKGEGKCGRKRKSPALEMEVETEANSLEEEVSSSVPKNKVARMSKVVRAKALYPWRALVAKMYYESVIA